MSDPQPISRSAQNGDARRADSAAGDASVRGSKKARQAPSKQARRFPGARVDEPRMLRLLRTAPVRRLRPVGATSVVFQTSLVGPVDAAFKLDSHDRPHAVASEVRAYRVARLLGLDNVPPAVARALPRATLQQRLHPAYMPAWAKIRHALDSRGRAGSGTSSGSVLRAAAIYWVPGLKDMGIESGRGMRRWRPWLGLDAGVPPARRALSADLSCMLAFDYLIGNWDRFSGSNAKGLPSEGRLVLRDHDIALAGELAGPVHARLWRRLGEVKRFSRDFVRRLRGLTTAALKQELAQDPGLRVPKSHARWVRRLLDRRQALLSHVDSLIELHGERKVLAFD